MKKTKSVSLLKIPALASSSKKSLQLDTNPLNWPRMTANHSSKNLAAFRSLKLHSTDIETDTTTSHQHVKSLTRPATVLKNRVTTLHQAIERLETEILNTKQLGKIKGKDYDAELKKHEEITKTISNCQHTLKQHKQKLAEINNRICMLNEDHCSAQMNIQQGLAQKEYYEEVIEQYRRQYENQAAVVLQMFDFEFQNKKIRAGVKCMEEQLITKQRNLEQWKNDMQFELQEKVAKNKLTQLRIQLMKAQQQANTYAESIKILKIREILCIFIKQSPQLHRLRMNENMDEEGMEIWVCKHGFLKQYEQAVMNYRGKDRAKYEENIMGKYFRVLGKIQGVVNNSRLKLNRKINQEYTEEIAALRIKIMLTQSKIVQNQRQIQQLSQKVEVVFANESVAIIEHLREKKGRYQLTQIKSTLKTLKQQQKSRIKKIKEIYQSFNQLKGYNFDVKSISFMNNLTQLNRQKQKCTSSMKDLQLNLKSLSSLKSQIENQISLAVSRWGELSCKKQELKRLYKDLNQLNKQIREAETLRFEQKQVKTLAKQNENTISMKKSDIIAKTMRETLKLRISGICNQTKNKQNEERLNTCKFEKSQIVLGRNNQQFQQNCRTRKPSLVQTKNNKLQSTYSQTSRDSLTAVLFSKFIS